MGLGAIPVSVPGGSTSGGTGFGTKKEADPWWYGVPTAEKPKKEKEKPVTKKIGDKKITKKELEPVLAKKTDPGSWEDIVGEAFGDDGAALLMALLED